MLSSRPTKVLTALVAIGFMSFAGCATTRSRSGVGAQRHTTYDARIFYETTSVTGASFSHDERRILFSSDTSGDSQTRRRTRYSRSAIFRSMIEFCTRRIRVETNAITFSFEK